jgi:integrase
MEPAIIAQRNEKVSMSPAVARDAALPTKGDYILWDSKTRYFGLRVNAGGAKVWFVQKKLGKSPCKVKLGAFPEMTYAKALSLVPDVVAKISKGIDPNLEKRQQIRETAKARQQESFTVLTCFEAYLANKEDPSNKPRRTTIPDLKRTLERLKAGSLASVPLIGLTGGLLEDLFRETANNAKRNNTNSGRTQAGRDMRYFRAAYRYCAEKYSLELPKADPFIALNKLVPGWYRVNAKDRTVAKVEGHLKKWWDAVEGLRPINPKHSRDVIADYLELSLLWGGRRTEMLSLTWGNINLEDGTVCFFKKDTKNSIEHVIPITRYARQLLEKRLEINAQRPVPSPFVFPSHKVNRKGELSHIVAPNAAIAVVVKKAGIDFSAHDLRRTFGTLFNELGGVTNYTVQRALNHAAQDTASKHYLQSRISKLRPVYQQFEDNLLIEAGVLEPQVPKVEVNAEQFAQFQQWLAQLSTD